MSIIQWANKKATETHPFLVAKDILYVDKNSSPRPIKHRSRYLIKDMDLSIVSRFWMKLDSFA